MAMKPQRQAKAPTVSAAPPQPDAPPSPTKPAGRADPVALCMSCNGSYPPDTAVCPNCYVSLSVVRKCPNCQRIQSAQHGVCIYCANSFMEAAPEHSPGKLGGLSRLTRDFRVIRMVAVAVALAGVLAIVFILRKPTPKPEVPVGQTYALRPASLRLSALPDAPPIKDVQAAEILDVIEESVDGFGNRWFRVTAQGVTGYVRTQGVAPPKSPDPDKMFALLRHSLLGMDDAENLSDAYTAADYYPKAFPTSPNLNELKWLLAERTRVLAETSGVPPDYLDRMRAGYQDLAAGNSQFAEPARQALARLDELMQAAGLRYRSEAKPRLAPGAAAGAASAGRSISSGAGNRRVRQLALMTRTPLPVRLTESVEVRPGKSFQGVIEGDIRVDGQVAVPKGSVSRLMIVGGKRLAGDADAEASVTMRMISLVIGNQTYVVSAQAERIEPPSGAKLSSSSLPLLAAGTRVVFRLTSPLVVNLP